jgi:hypothetical protein
MIAYSDLFIDYCGPEIHPVVVDLTVPVVFAWWESCGVFAAEGTQA